MPLAFARSVLTGGSSKSYTLTRSASNVNEGSSVTFTLNSSGMNGESVPYTITGITDSDISSGSLTGNIAINSDETGSASITTRADWHTEGAENLTFTIGSGYQQYADENGYSTSVTVNDTSLTPRVNSITRSASSVDEGSYVDLTFNTSNCRTNAGTAGTRIYFKITGIQSADIASVGGTPSSPTYGAPPVNASTMTTEYGYVVTNSTSSPYIRINMAADQLTEGSQTMTVTVTRLYDYQGDGDGTVAVDGVTSQTVTINDTSITHPTGQVQFYHNHNFLSENAQGYSSNYGYFARYNQHAAYSNSYNATYTVSTTNWTIPSGVNDLSIVAIGAGAGGGLEVMNSYSNNFSNIWAGGSGGGGGGLAARDYRNAKPGQVLTMKVGRGGATGYRGHPSTVSHSQGGTMMIANAGQADGVNGNTSGRGDGNGQDVNVYTGNNYTGRAGGTASFYNISYNLYGLNEANGYHRRWAGQGGAGGKGSFANNQQYATGGGGGGTGGYGSHYRGQTHYGGAGGYAGINGQNASNQYAAGGAGGGSRYRGGNGGDTGIDGPNATTSYSNSGKSVTANQASNGHGGHSGSPWSGTEYGGGGGGGGAYTYSGDMGGSGSIRVKWTSGSTWDSSNTNYN